MGGITLEFAQTRLDAYLAAEEAALANKSYTINGRSFTRQDLDDIRKGIEIWNGRVQKLSQGSGLGIRLRAAEVM